MTEQAIELLGWTPLSERLTASLERAFAGAAAGGRKEVSLEHLLAALLEDVDANVYLAGRGVDRDKIRAHCLAKIGAAAMPSAALQPGDAAEARAAGAAGGETGAVAMGGDSYFFTRDSRGAAAEDRIRPAYHDGYAAPAPGRRGRPAPSRALRRLMARASEMADRAGSDILGGELTVQAVALDDAADTGRLLQRLLPGGEIARLRAAYQPERRAAAEAAAAAKRRKSAPLSEAAFEALVKRIETLLHTLHRELQKDVRYRIANDLSAFVSRREGAEDGYGRARMLENSALPILQATRAELERDPQFRALERVRAVLRAVREEESALRGALAELMRGGLLEEEGALTKAARALVALPAPQGGESDRSEDALTVAAVDPTAAIQGAPREGAAIGAVLPAPAQAEPAAPQPTPILNRVLGSVRPASQMFARRRNGAAETAEPGRA